MGECWEGAGGGRQVWPLRALAGEPRSRTPHVTALLAAALCGCATPRYLQSPPLAELSSTPADFSGIPIRVRTVEAVDPDGRIGPGLGPLLKNAIEESLPRVIAFADERLGRDLNPLILDVDVRATHAKYRTWLLDAVGIYPGIGLFWPLIPEWGQIELEVSAVATDGFGTRVWADQSTYRSRYWLLFYAWYRSRPQERAAVEAYRKAVAGTVDKLAKAATTIRAAMAASADSSLVAGGAGNGGGVSVSALSRPGADDGVAASASLDGLALTTPAQILVLDLKSVGNVPKHVASVLTRIFLSSLQTVHGVKTFGTDDLQAMLDVEKQKDLLGCNDTSCLAQMGGALGAELVLYGDVSSIGSQYSVNLTVVDTGHAAVRVRISQLMRQDEDELVRALPTLVRKVIAQLNETP